MLKQDEIWALGTMSGTALDGVDAALVLTDGHAILGFGEGNFRPYSGAERATIAAALGRWPGDAGVVAAAEVVETATAELLAGMTRGELIGFHGQTLAHEPDGRGTHQVGDGAVLAQVLNRPVVWDFRSNDIEMGGQGAPLAPFYHFACARWIKAGAPLVFLNLGGVGNITWVDPNRRCPEDPDALLAFDTGPANAPLNDLLFARRGQDFDLDGGLAASGEVNAPIVERFITHPYFHKIPPKSLDRNSFANIVEVVSTLPDADAAATLTALAASAVVKAMEHCPTLPTRVLVSGGGRKNPVMMAMLAAGLDCAVQPVEDVNLDGDMLEAQAFAYLAVRVLKGLPTSCPATTGVGAPVGGGKISRPAEAR